MKRRPIRNSFIAIAWMLLIVAHPGGGQAADHQLITSVALIHEYNDNIQLNTNNALSDNITTVAPRLEMVRHSERYTVQADGKLEFYRFEDYDEFDDMDQWYNGSLEATPTERWRVGADVHVSEDNRPDRDIDETGLVLSNIRRRRINTGASTDYTFTEMTAGGLSVEFNRENFDDAETSDRQDYHAVLSLTHSLDDWLARTTGRLYLGYSHYAFTRDYDFSGSSGNFEITTFVSDDYEIDNYSLTIGTLSELTEKLDLTVDLGGRYANSQRSVETSRIFYSPPIQIVEAPTINDDTFDTYGFVASVNFGYQGERSRCDLLFSHDLQPVSGQNSAVNRTMVRASGSLRILEHLRGNFYGQWYLNDSDQDDPTQDEVDTQTWNVGGGFRWAMNDYFDLAVTYGYTIYEDRDADTTAYRNRAMVSLEAHHDWLE